MKKFFLISILTIVLMLLFTDFAEAQCAMCRQTAEKAAQENKGIGESLNTGIVYIMIAPYLLLGTLALVFFRKKIAAFFRS
jgi:hypothetical protein